jgi:hypothetical protein
MSAALPPFRRPESAKGSRPAGAPPPMLLVHRDRAELHLDGMAGALSRALMGAPLRLGRRRLRRPRDIRLIKATVGPGSKAQKLAFWCLIVWAATSFMSDSSSGGAVIGVQALSPSMKNTIPLPMPSNCAKAA